MNDYIELEFFDLGEPIALAFGEDLSDTLELVAAVKGEPGPPGDGSTLELPDLTLIFENALIGTLP